MGLDLQQEHLARASWRMETRHVGSPGWEAAGAGLWRAHGLQLATEFSPDLECLAGLRARRAQQFPLLSQKQSRRRRPGSSQPPNMR